MLERVPKGGWKSREHSHSKAIVYFTDGSIRTFWSYDWRHRYAKRDRDVGLEGLRNRIVQRFSPHARTIVIIDIHADKIIEKYVAGEKVPL